MLNIIFSSSLIFFYTHLHQGKVFLKRLWNFHRLKIKAKLDVIFYNVCNIAQCTVNFKLAQSPATLLLFVLIAQISVVLTLHWGNSFLLQTKTIIENHQSKCRVVEFIGQSYKAACTKNPGKHCSRRDGKTLGAGWWENWVQIASPRNMNENLRVLYSGIKYWC